MFSVRCSDQCSDLNARLNALGEHVVTGPKRGGGGAFGAFGPLLNIYAAHALLIKIRLQTENPNDISMPQATALSFQHTAPSAGYRR